MLKNVLLTRVQIAIFAVEASTVLHVETLSTYHTNKLVKNERIKILTVAYVAFELLHADSFRAPSLLPFFAIATVWILILFEFILDTAFTKKTSLLLNRLTLKMSLTRCIS